MSILFFKIDHFQLWALSQNSCVFPGKFAKNSVSTRFFYIYRHFHITNLLWTRRFTKIMLINEIIPAYHFPERQGL